MADKLLVCPNCNGMGPFLVLKTVDKVDRNGIADREFPMAPPQTFYMCKSSEGDGSTEGCMMVSTLEELTR